MDKQNECFVVPDGCILIQESDAVPFVHPEYGAGVFFTDDCMLEAAPTPPTSAADVIINWPKIPPLRGQSHVLFEDGYAEGWLKCLEACQKALASTGKGQS